MRKFQPVFVLAAALVVLSFVSGSGWTQQSPDPQQIAQQCVDEVTKRAARRVKTNQAAAVQCTTEIRALVEKGNLPRAVHVARRCVHRIVSSSHYTERRIKHECLQCIHALINLDAPRLVEVVADACSIAAMGVADSRQQAVQLILDALPDGVAVIVLTPCLADIDNDRAVNVADFLDLFAAWGTDPDGPPDLDFDGMVAIQDMVIMVQAWGACPE